jgi:hypothetical protein
LHSYYNFHDSVQVDERDGPPKNVDDLIYQIRVEKNIELARYDSPLGQMLYATIAVELIELFIVRVSNYRP